MARLRADFDFEAAGPDTASATAASTVAFHVRKSLAEKSPPVTSLTYALMSADLRSRQRRPSRYASSSREPPRLRFSSDTIAYTSASTIDWTRRCPLLAG